MDFRSCLYECQVMHRRYERRGSLFRYRLFMFFLDIDELDLLDRRLFLFGKNCIRAFSFYEKDHFVFQERARGEKREIRARVEEILSSHGLPDHPDRIMLLTNLRVFGYVFNPVSFYYCYDKESSLYAVVAEVNNTYKEQKAYVIPFKEEKREESQTKLFYVSPFIEYDTDFYFRFNPPDNLINVRIDSRREDRIILKAVLHGRRRRLNERTLVAMLFRYPFITLKIIVWIHLQALRLYLWKIPYFSKASSDKAFSALQTGLKEVEKS